MLRHLHLTNFAILSDVAIELGPGMNVLTGETGAGKSLIVDAVNLLRGGRASADIPRAGCEQAIVEAVFDQPCDDIRKLLEEAGIPCPGDELVVRRVIQRGGRSRTYINSALSTAALLAQVGQFLVDLAGQHQHQGLVKTATHRRVLDSFAGTLEMEEQMQASWRELAELKADVEALASDEHDRQERIDFLRFQLQELRAAELRPGEEDEIRDERKRLAMAEKLVAAARQCEDALAGERRGNARDGLVAALRAIETLDDPPLTAMSEQIAEALAIVEDAAAEARDYYSGIEDSPERLAELDDRLAMIKRMTRRHGATVEAVLAKQEVLEDELHRLSNADTHLQELENRLAAAERSALELAEALSAGRKRAATKLEQQVVQYLEDLDLKGASLRVGLTECPLHGHGVDSVEFVFSANPGEPHKPLAKVASGGELSRLMLAMKVALRQADRVATYVFDEVDAGIGGVTANAVGKQIRAVADLSQVLCVTHLPQIAAFADRHIHVEKGEVDGRIETEVALLTRNQRRAELARMLGGKGSSKHARAHADELLSAADRA